MARDALARRLAEQVAVDCGFDQAADVLAGPVVARLHPILRLAGDAGEAAGLVVLGDPSPPDPNRCHELSTTESRGGGGVLCRSFRWHTSHYRTLFQVLDGELEARLADPGVILSIEGTYVVPEGLDEQSVGARAARRAAEAAVRALLGHLRSALEPITPR